MSHRPTIGRRPPHMMCTLFTLLLLPACFGEETGPSTVDFHVYVYGDGDGSGLVTVQVPDVPSTSWTCHIVDGDAPDGCWRTYNSNAASDVIFTINADAGSTFVEWDDSWDCSGTSTTCRVQQSVVANQGEAVAQARLEAIPEVTLTVGGHDAAINVLQGDAEPAEATATRVGSGTAITDATFGWASSDPSVAVVSSSTTGSATVTALGAGTATITATTRGVTSNPVTVNVAGVEVAKGVIRGVVYDTAGVTPLDSVHLSMGPVAGSSGSGARGRSGRQIPGEEPIEPGGYRFEVDNGQYAIFAVAMLGSRYVTTPGDTAFVFAGDTTELNLNIKSGYHLDMRTTDVGTLSASAGDTIEVVVDYQVWSRDLCPGCVPSIAIGVDANPLTVHRFGVPGIYPGKTERGVAIPVVVPSSGGTIYAYLVTASTGVSIQPGLDQYASVWDRNLQGSTMIPIGKLAVN